MNSTELTSSPGAAPRGIIARRRAENGGHATPADELAEGLDDVLTAVREMLAAAEHEEREDQYTTQAILIYLR